MKEDEKPEVSTKSVMILNLGGAAIVLLTMGVVYFVVSFCDINLWETSFFHGLSMILSICFPIVMLPLAVFGECWLSRWKKRGFVWKNAVAVAGLFGVFVGVNIFLLSIFDRLFSELTWIWQTPFFAVSNTSGLLTLVIIVRNKKFKRWRKDFGW
jgi:hypothetical protein